MRSFTTESNLFGVNTRCSFKVINSSCLIKTNDEIIFFRFPQSTTLMQKIRYLQFWSAYTLLASGLWGTQELPPLCSVPRQLDFFYLPSQLSQNQSLRKHECRSCFSEDRLETRILQVQKKLTHCKHKNRQFTSYLMTYLYRYM